MSAAAVVEMTGVSKTFVLHQRAGARLDVLRDATLRVHAGECLVLDGPSGVGKSTLLKLIYGTYRASSGAIHVNAGGTAVDVATASDQMMLRLRRDAICYVSQFLRAIPRVPAEDVVAEPLIEAEGGLHAAAARDSARALLARLRVPERLWSLAPATFSGGEQQRVNIARSFIRRKPLMLLDEPTASLDAANRDTVITMINEVRAAGVAIIGVFHDQHVREAVATRVVNLTAFQ